MTDMVDIHQGAPQLNPPPALVLRLTATERDALVEVLGVELDALAELSEMWKADAAEWITRRAFSTTVTEIKARLEELLCP